MIYYISSIVFEDIETISSLFIFLGKDFEWRKSTKMQNKQFFPS